MNRIRNTSHESGGAPGETLIVRPVAGRLHAVVMRAGLLVATVIAGAGPCHAEAFLEDFESANPDAWSNAQRPKARLLRSDGNTVLQIEGRQQQTLPIPAPAMRDFDLRVEVRGPGGVHFRDDFKIFFKGNGNVWIRRPGAMLLRWVRQRRDMGKFHTIRVVAIGRIVRIYIDDTMELECLDHGPKAGRFAFCGSGHFDDLRILDTVPLREALMAIPRDAGADFMEEGAHEQLKVEGPRVPDIALAFKKGEPVRVPVRVLNEGDPKVDVLVDAAIDDFSGNVLSEPTQRAVTLSGQSEAIVQTDFGVIAPGFHRMKLTIRHEGKKLRTVPYPIFVGVPAEPVGLEVPTIPFAVMLKKIVWRPIHTKTYWHAIAATLREHHVTTVIASGGCHREFPEIFERYGVWTMVRSENRLHHRAVTGLVNWNKRPEAMKALQARFDKPVLTYLAAEKIGTGGAEDPLEVWEQTQPAIRMVRIAPFRGQDKDWLAQESDRSLDEALYTAYTASATPWWAMLQATNTPENAEGGRVPTAAEVRAQTHLALACGAKGLVYHALQSGVEMSAMVDRVSLRPVDGRLHTVGELGALVSKQGRAIAAFEPVAAPVKCHPATVRAVRGRKHVYLINTDPRRRIEGGVVVPMTLPPQVKDLYGGGAISTSPADDKATLDITLEPGGGRLLLLE